MPTPLTKPVRREVLAYGVDELLRTHVVELHADGVRFREKRRRSFVLVPWSALAAYTPDPSRDVRTRHYALNARLAPEGVVYREHGTKRAYTLPHGVAFQRAVTLTVAQDRADRAAKRAGKRAPKRSGTRARATRL
jgi:hypothetical protein